MKPLTYFLTAIISFWALVSCNNSSRNEQLKEDAVRIIRNKSIEIAYSDEGESDTTLLFVHGWAINKSYRSSQTASFGKRYRVVAIDLPGFGESGKNRDTLGTAEYASHVDSVIKE